jgi:hypothetical protein
LFALRAAAPSDEEDTVIQRFFLVLFLVLAFINPCKWRIWSGGRVGKRADRFIPQFSRRIETTSAAVPRRTVESPFWLRLCRVMSSAPDSSPHAWELRVAGGDTLLSTTFSNLAANQAYPDEAPGGDHPVLQCRFPPRAHARSASPPNLYIPDKTAWWAAWGDVSLSACEIEP